MMFDTLGLLDAIPVSLLLYALVRYYLQKRFNNTQLLTHVNTQVSCKHLSLQPVWTLQYDASFQQRTSDQDATHLFEALSTYCHNADTYCKYMSSNNLLQTSLVASYTTVQQYLFDTFGHRCDICYHSDTDTSKLYVVDMITAAGVYEAQYKQLELLERTIHSTLQQSSTLSSDTIQLVLQYSKLHPALYKAN